MGKAGRWLKSFLGGKKAAAETTEEAPDKDKKRWPFGRFASVLERPSAGKVVEERLGSHREIDSRDCDDNSIHRNKHAIAVAAATAAVAEAAVAAAQAAAAVVQLTNTCQPPPTAAFGKNDHYAATRIQAAFRGYLARRALRALKGLVKVQALVRGYIVRKQASQTLRCMQALVRVQTRARARRLHHFDCTSLSRSHLPVPGEPESGSDHGAPMSWLDRWVNSHGGAEISGDGETTKILEVDPGKPLFNTKRMNNSINSRSMSFIATPASPSKGSTIPLFPSPSSSVDMPPRLCVFSASSQKLGPSEYAWSEISGCTEYPNYMSNTESWRAKARSRSAPRLRPAEFEKCGSGRRVQGFELTDARSSVSPVLSQRSSSLHAKFTSKAYPGSGRLDRLGMPVRAGG